MEAISAPDRLRVVVVDDSEVVRMKLRGLLSAAPDFELVGEAPDGETGLHAVREHQPDLVVMDLRMPGISGIEATWQLGTLAWGSPTSPSSWSGSATRSKCDGAP